LRRIRPSDVKASLLVALTALIAWTLPERTWAPIARALTRASRALGGQSGFRYTRLTDRTVERMGRSRAEYIFAGGAQSLEHSIRAMAEYRPGGSPTRTTLTGKEGLVAALAGGHGAIVWVLECPGASLWAKMGLARAGFRPYHLSRASHGGSVTPFGLYALNGIQRHTENRFLAARILISDDNSPTAIRRLRRELDQNHVVTISYGLAARRILQVPMLDGMLSLSAGPLELARQSGAPVIPLFTLDHGGGRVELLLGAPLHPGPGPEGIIAAATAFAAELDGWVTAHPTSWSGFFFGSFLDAAPATGGDGS
jgi:lauroyl/myristoyl acyltransferase